MFDYSKTLESERDYPKFEYDKALKTHCDHFANYLMWSPRANPQYAAVCKKLVDDYKNAEDKTKTKLWAEQKEKFDGIVNHSRAGQLIPKEYWADFDELIGSAAKVCCHQHMIFAQARMLEILEKEKRSDILVAVPCSSTKPYSSVGRIQRFANCSRETRLFDLLVFSVNPIFVTPIDFTICYPFANYSDPDNVESKLWAEVMYNLSVKHMAEAVRRLGYRKIIVAHGGTLEPRIRYMREWGFGEQTLIDVFNIDLYHKACKFKFSSKELPEPKKFYKGMMKSRFLSGNEISCFMRDVFGPQVFPYFKTGWEHVENGVKEYAGYSEAKVKEIVDKLGIMSERKPIELIW